MEFLFFEILYVWGWHRLDLNCTFTLTLALAHIHKQPILRLQHSFAFFQVHLIAYHLSIWSSNFCSHQSLQSFALFVIVCNFAITPSWSQNIRTFNYASNVICIYACIYHSHVHYTLLRGYCCFLRLNLKWIAWAELRMVRKKTIYMRSKCIYFEGIKFNKIHQQQKIVNHATISKVHPFQLGPIHQNYLIGFQQKRKKRMFSVSSKII